MVTSYKRISMSSRATNIIKQSKRLVLFNGTYWCTPKLYARGVACGKSSHVTRKIEEKLKFQVLWKCNEYEYFVPFFVNHNRSQWKSTLHTFNSFECFIIFVRAFWRAHIFLAAGHFEQNQQKLCKNQSNDVHISNIWTKYFIHILSMLKFVIVCLYSNKLRKLQSGRILIIIYPIHLQKYKITGCKQVHPKGHLSNVFKNVSQKNWKRYCKTIHSSQV